MRILSILGRTLGYAASGAVLGAVAGAGLGLMNTSRNVMLDAGLDAILAAALGAVLGPIAGWMLRGRVGPWRAAGAAVLGALAGAAAGLAAGGYDAGRSGCVLGLVAALVAVRMIPPAAPRAERLRWILAAGAVLALCVGASAASHHAESRHLLREVLNVPALPGTAREITCTSYGFSDVLVRCAFAVEPAEFARLLAGWEFTASPCDGSSHHVAGGPAVGPEFPLMRCYQASPPAFEHGGRVLIAADGARRRVVADLYIE